MNKNLLIFFPLLIFFIFIIYTSLFIFEGIPHSQDEVAYLFQAKVFKSGRLYLTSLPENIRRFFDHEFIVNNGRWYAKYPPGQSIFLTVGLFLNSVEFVNPLFSLGSLIIFFFLSKLLFSVETALLAAFFMSFSPFFILLSSSFMSHPPVLFFTLMFFYSLAKVYHTKPKKQSRKYYFIVGLSLGFIFVLRPINLIILLVFFFLFSIYDLFIKNFDRDQLLQKYIFFFVPFGILIAVHLVYNKILTNSFLKFPFNVYSPYDTIGFGERGVEWGLQFAFKDAVNNLKMNFEALQEFLFAWPSFWIVFFAFLSFLKKNWLVSLFLIICFVSQIILYFFYFSAGTFLGPRYWFELSWIPILLTSQGIISFLNFLKKLFGKKIFMPLYLTLIILIIVFSLQKDLNYLPQFKAYNGMYKVNSPSLSSSSLVFIPGEADWQSYGRYFSLQSPVLNENKIIFARDRAIHNVPKNLPPVDNKLLIKYFPDRKFYLLVQNKLKQVK